MEYTVELETLFKQEAEKAESMGIMHCFSFQKYSKLSILTNVPVIILSTLIGFLSTLDLFPSQNILLGALSLSVSVIKTIDSYFDLTKLSEAHRITGLAYNKVFKLIQIQLSIERKHRIAPDDLMSVITHDLQNLKDSEPVIGDDIIARYNKRYAQESTTKPSIANGLSTIKVIEPKVLVSTASTGTDSKESRVRVHLEV